VISTSPNLTRTIIHVGGHNHVVDDFDITALDKRMEEMIKKVVGQKQATRSHKRYFTLTLHVLFPQNIFFIIMNF
jgi:hypothetical protein